MTESNKQSLPTHLGLILDGNRRWAKAKGLPTLEGHRQGAEVFREIALATFEKGITYLSAYVFSAENWSRTEGEVDYLMKLVIKATEKYLDTFHKAGIRVIVLGRRDGVSQDVLDAIERTETKTKDNTKGTLALCFNYGGREELVDASRAIAAQGTSPSEITEELLRSHLYHPEIPDIDLLIRTSGEHRSSGFMLYRTAYSELYFIDKHWPDFTVDDLKDALITFSQRERRYGK
jgi:undecaprenyl diphosphate synthase